MDNSVDQPPLRRALHLIERILPSRLSLAARQSVLLEAEELRAEEGKLRVSTSDGEVALATAIAAAVSSPGRARVPARLLVEYVGGLSDEAVRLTLDRARKRVSASSGRFHADLPSLDPEGSLEFPSSEPESTIRLPPLALRRAIASVAFAACRDDSRPTLRAVLFELGAQGLTLCATDGFRLARARVGDVHAPSQQFLVPARAVEEFGKLLVEGEGTSIGLARDGRGVFLTSDETALYSRLVDGHFPDVESVIPKSWETRLTVDRKALLQVVRLASLFSSSRAGGRSVVLDAQRGALKVRSRGEQPGEAEGEIGAVVEGVPQAIALGTSLFTDILEAVESKEVELSWTRPTRPLVIREAGSADSADLWLQMPVWEQSLSGHAAG